MRRTNDTRNGTVQLQPVRLRKTRGSLRGLLMRSVGAAALVCAALPFLGTTAKANLQQWGNAASHKATAPLPADMSQVRSNLSQVAHTNTTTHYDQAHTDHNYHGDHTPPAELGLPHVDESSHTNVNEHTDGNVHTDEA